VGGPCVGSTSSIGRSRGGRDPRQKGQVGFGHLAAKRLADDYFVVGIAEPEPLISRQEVIATMFMIADIAVHLSVIRGILEENDEEEEDQ
jgi:hypothetical protein